LEVRTAGDRTISPGHRRTWYVFCSFIAAVEVLPDPCSEGGERLADYVTVATLVLPLPGDDDDSEERLEKAEGLAAAVRLYAEVFEADPGGDPEVVHRFARMLLALEEFELVCLCPEQRLERLQQIERHRRLVADEDEREPVPSRLR
jgi:hypothetical protein